MNFFSLQALLGYLPLPPHTLPTATLPPHALPTAPMPPAPLPPAPMPHQQPVQTQPLDARIVASTPPAPSASATPGRAAPPNIPSAAATAPNRPSVSKDGLGKQQQRKGRPKTGSGSGGQGSGSSGGGGGRLGVQCPTCGKPFNNSSALAKHKLTHSEERKYGCHICSKAFKRQDHLNGHMMTHRSKKPYECKFEGCTKSYCDARSLRRHLENHHQVPSSMETSLASVPTGMPPPSYNPNGSSSSEAFGSYPTGGAAVGYGGQTGAASSPHTSPGYPHPGSAGPTTGGNPAHQYFDFDSAAQGVAGGAGAGYSLPAQMERWGHAAHAAYGARPSYQPMGAGSAGGQAQAAMSRSDVSPQAGGGGAAYPGSQMSPLGSPGRQAGLPPPAHHAPLMHSHSAGGAPGTSLSPTSPGGGGLRQGLHHQMSAPTGWPMTPYGAMALADPPKPVECTICHRRFKNLPALNGHMRLHGGYVKKKTDSTSSVTSTGSREGQQVTTPADPQSGISTLHSTGAPGGFEPGETNPSSGTPGGGLYEYDLGQQQGRQHHHSGPSEEQATDREAHHSGGSVEEHRPLGVKGETGVGDGGGASAHHQTGPKNSLTRLEVEPAANRILLHQLPGSAPTSSSVVSGGLAHPQPVMAGSGPTGLHRGVLAGFGGGGVGVPAQMGGPAAPNPYPYGSSAQGFNEERSAQFSTTGVADGESPAGTVGVATVMPYHRQVLPADVQMPGKMVESVPHPPTMYESEANNNASSGGAAVAMTPLTVEVDGDYGQHDELACINAGRDWEEESRKRHMSADPDKFTAKRRALGSRYVGAIGEAAADEAADVEIAKRERRKSEDLRGSLDGGPGTRRSGEFKQPGIPAGPASVDRYSRSDSAVIFKQPEGSAKRKQRPGPIAIPATSRFNYASRLRSPVVGPVDKGWSKKSPPPYTPPPILSPTRRASGLFANLYQKPAPPPLTSDPPTGGSDIQPQTAAGGASTTSTEASSVTTVTVPTVTVSPAAQVADAVYQPPTSTHQVTAECHATALDESAGTLATVAIATETPVSLVEELEQAAEVVIEGKPSAPQPQINIGSEFQAMLPKCRVDKSGAARDPHRADLMFTPKVYRSDASGSRNFHTDAIKDGDQYIGEAMKPTEDMVKKLEVLACTKAVHRGGRNLELALHLLHKNRGNLSLTLTELLSGRMPVPEGHPMASYTYPGVTEWSFKEVIKFKEAFKEKGKDFLAISRVVGTKTSADCVELYYLWKQMYPVEVDKLKPGREQLLANGGGMNLRSRGEVDVDMEPGSRGSTPPPLSSNSSSFGGTPQEHIREFSPQPAVLPAPPPPRAPRGSPRPYGSHPVHHGGGVGVYGGYSSAASSGGSVFSCDKPGCTSVFPSKQALNGHARIHSSKLSADGGPGSNHPSPRRSPGPSAVSSPAGGVAQEFPCQLCGKVFLKVKSRSAHMKSHRQKERAEKERQDQHQQQSTHQGHSQSHQQSSHQTAHHHQQRTHIGHHMSTMKHEYYYH